MKSLQKEKLKLTEGLLARLEELKKAKEDVSLCEAISEKTTEISSPDHSWNKSLKRSSSSMAGFGKWR